MKMRADAYGGLNGCITKGVRKLTFEAESKEESEELSRLLSAARDGRIQYLPKEWQSKGERA